MGQPEDAAERTDPNLTPPDFETAPSAVQSDPVLAAMAELDGLQNIPESALSAASATVRAPTPQVGMDAAALEDAPTVRADGEAPTQDAPRRSVSLSLPKPGGATTKPMPAAAPIVDDEDAFSGLEAPSTDSRINDLEAGGIWATYKEVIVASVVGVLLLTGAVVYSTTKGKAPAKAVVLQPPPMMPRAPTPPPTKAVVPAPKRETQPPPKAATPMLTIVTIPSGALVEVNGVVYGKSPLIMPAPRELSTLVVQLKLNNHKTWSGEIKPNKAGHFSERIELTPLR